MADTEDPTCTGCRKPKPLAEFQRYGRKNLTCNACSERHRTRKAKAAAAAQQTQQQQQQQDQSPQTQQPSQQAQPTQPHPADAITTKKEQD